MDNKNLAVVGVVVLVVILGGLYLYSTNSSDQMETSLSTVQETVESEFPSQEDSDIAQEEAMMDSSESGDSMEVMDSEQTQEAATQNSPYDGRILAEESRTKFIEFNEEDFNRAVADGKTIYLEFYANWCPTCRAQEPDLIAGFNQLDDPDIVGFRVNYKDSDTDSAEADLANRYNVGYQHHKVILRNGRELLNENAIWDTETMLEEINSVT